MGLITDIQRFSINDGPGIRTTVFFKGCNLDCAWCHNPETKKPYPQRQLKAGAASTCGMEISAEELVEKLARDKPFYDRSQGGVTFSGGEPMLQLNFLKACLSLCKAKKLHTAVDTAGNVPFSSFADILNYTDLFLYDMKAANPETHKKHTGAANERILENLYLLHDLCVQRNDRKENRAQTELVIRTPLLPGINDNAEEFTGIANIIKELHAIKEFDILPYHAMGEGKYAAIGEKNRYSGIKPPTDEHAGYFQRLTQGILADKIVKVIR